MTLLSSLSIFCALGLLFIPPFQGFGHIVAALWRRFVRKKPPRWDRSILLRFLFVTGAGGILVGAIILSVMRPKWSDFLGSVAGFTMLAVVLILPIWYLVSAYRKSRSHFAIGSYLLALAALGAMPVVATGVYAASVGAYGYLVGAKDEGTQFMQMGDAYFVKDAPTDGACVRLLKVIDPHLEKGTNTIADHIEFWFDQTLKGSFFDAAEVFDCRVTNYRNNPENIGFAALIFLYRMVSSVIVVGILIWPFARLKEKRAQEEGTA